MGRRGPAPKPNALRLLSGQRVEPGPVPAMAPVECPEWLSDDARAVWDRLAPDLERQGVLTHWDTEALGQYCDAVVRHREAAAALDDEGPVVVGARGGAVTNPQMHVWKSTAEVAARIAARFGLTPSDRQQVKVTPPASAPSDLLSS